MSENSHNEDEQVEDRDADFSALNEDSEGREQVDLVEGSDRGVAEGDAGEIQRLTIELEEQKDRYLRTAADFENYKKRALKERADLLKYQGDKILSDFLEVADNLELALHHSNSDPESLKAGVELIYKLCVDTLGKWEVRAQSGLGLEFNPNIHNAISKVQVDDAAPGTVINELKKAYFYKDRLLRAGEVVVADTPVTSSDEDQ